MVDHNPSLDRFSSFEPTIASAETDSAERVARQHELFRRLTGSLESLHDVRIDEIERQLKRCQFEK